MPFIASRGRSIYYERHGAGPGVLFLHGAGSNAATWWQQLPAFRAHYSCITMDIRCFGRSVAPLAEFTQENFVADVTAVLDAENVRRVVIVGQSLGGMIGLRMVLDHPDRVEGFVACDSMLALDHPVLLDILAQRRITHRSVSIEERSLGRWFLQHHPEKAALYKQINHFNPAAHSVPEAEWGRALAALLQPGHLVALQALKQVACPALFLVGRDDPLVPVSVMEDVTRIVPGSELAVVDEAGHSAYFEKPAEVNRLVLDFLARRTFRDPAVVPSKAEAP